MSVWTPESPFLESPFLESSSTFENSEDSSINHSIATEAPWLSSETPFIRDEYETSTQRSVELQFVSNFLSDVRDDAFETSINNLVSNARSYLKDRYDGEYGAVGAQSEQAERELEQYFMPIHAEAINMLGNLGQEFDKKDLSNLSNNEIDTLLAQHIPNYQLSNPDFENFLGSLFKKAANAVKGAVNLAKKGVSSLTNLGIGSLLKRLEGLVMPLLKRVIQVALNKLPLSVRPIAQKIAHQLFGMAAQEYETSLEAHPNSTSAEQLQQEFDLHLVDTLINVNDSYESETYLADESNIDTSLAMHGAKTSFVNEFSNLEQGQNPLPIIQNFLPAALLALQPVIKTVISVIGRPRVVEFIADLLAKLVERWVGKEAAKSLALPVVDMGLGMLGFELNEQNPKVITSEIIAETLESTVLQLVQLPQSVFENDIILEAEVRNAFESAAAAYFPDSVIRSELRETGKTTGNWVAMPLKHKRKYYRKYSKVFDVDITPQVASKVTIYGGATLADYFSDVLLLPPKQNVKGRIHLYELTIGSRLVDISMRENNIPGLGSTKWQSWLQLHPLTNSAAVGLLNEPSLAKQVDAVYLANPYVTGIGQRFYYIQIPGIIKPNVSPAISTTPMQTFTCTSSTSVIVDLGQARLSVKLKFSERTAQEIAQALRRNDIAGAWRIAKTLNNSLIDQIKKQSIGFKLIGFELESYVGLSNESSVRLPQKALEWFLEKIADKLFDILWDSVANYFKNTAQEFIKATENQLDGVTITLTFVNLPGLNVIKNLRTGNITSLVLPNIDQTITRPSMSINPGCNK